jgi:predicted XRE-type DNA-binding protein
MAGSVFYDLAETPEEAANLTARGLLMIAIEQRIKEEGWTQAEAAARLHVTQPRVSDLLNGKISKFSLDALVNMLPPVGLTFDVRPAERRPARAAKKGTPAHAHRPAKAASRKRKALSRN